MAIEDISKFGFDLYYRITNIITEKPVALIKTGIVCYDYKLRKIAAIPDKAVELLSV